MTSNDPTPLFNWSDYLIVAKRLRDGVSSSCTPEADQRCAVSRAYYAAFHLVMQHSQAHWHYIASERGDDHGGLRRHLRTHKQHQLAKSLEILVSLREDCDYRPTVEDLAASVEEAISVADKVVAQLKSMK